MQTSSHLTVVSCLALAVLLTPGSAAGQVFEYYHSDAAGSVRAITDTNGAVVERHD